MSHTVLAQVHEGRLDAERLSGHLDSERQDLRAWEERLKERKAELEQAQAAVEGETTCGRHRTFVAGAINRKVSRSIADQPS